MLAAYTGAWYPTYFEVGVNWASRNYDVSKDFSWATPDYKNYGFAELTGFLYEWQLLLECNAGRIIINLPVNLRMKQTASFLPENIYV